MNVNFLYYLFATSDLAPYTSLIMNDFLDLRPRFSFSVREFAGGCTRELGWNKGVFKDESGFSRAAVRTDFSSFLKNNLQPEAFNVLSIYGHSDGIDGVLYDEKRRRSVSIKDLNAILTATGFKIDLIIFNSCWMAMAEIAYELSDSCRYLLASSHVVPYAGVSPGLLTESLDILYNTSSVCECTSFLIRSCSWRYVLGAEKAFLKSMLLFKLSNAPLLCSAAYSFVEKLLNFPEVRTHVAAIVRDLPCSAGMRGLGEPYISFRDFYLFMSRISGDEFFSQELRLSSLNVMACIERIIPDFFADTLPCSDYSLTAYLKSPPVSVYLPSKKRRNSMVKKLKWFTDSGWKDFISYLYGFY